MRTSSTCPKCGHHEILHAGVPDLAATGSISHAQAATIVRPGLFGKTLDMAGHLTSSICRSCGYCELYCLEPDKIPIDGEWVTLSVGDPQQPSSPARRGAFSSWYLESGQRAASWSRTRQARRGCRARARVTASSHSASSRRIDAG